MSQISQAEAGDLLGKLFTERISVQAFFFSRSGTRVSFVGFVDSVTCDKGVAVSASGPPIDLARGYLAFMPFNAGCEFWYGEQRELPPEIQQSLSAGESCLLFKLPEFGEQVALFFTIETS